MSFTLNFSDNWPQDLKDLAIHLYSNIPLSPPLTIRVHGDENLVNEFISYSMSHVNGPNLGYESIEFAKDGGPNSYLIPNTNYGGILDDILINYI
jgi:hypothetical protein